MELSFLDLKEREIINVFDGKKLGRVIDIVFNNESGLVRGIVVPGDRKMFHRADDLFIPIDKIKRIGNDVILVGVQRESTFFESKPRRDFDKNIKVYENYYNRYNPSVEPPPERRRASVDAQLGKKTTENSFYYGGNPPKTTNNAVSYVRLRPIDRKKYK